MNILCIASLYAFVKEVNPLKQGLKQTGWISAYLTFIALLKK